MGRSYLEGADTSRKRKNCWTNASRSKPFSIAHQKHAECGTYQLA